MEIRIGSRADVDRLLAWAAAEGWNPGLHDATPMHAADPLGFLVAVDQGEAIGGISVVKYSPDFGFLGLYIVRSDCRGLGVGLRLWNAGMDHLAGCTVGLDGVIAQQANYVRSGFTLAYRQIRFGGLAKPTKAPDSTINLLDVPFDEILSFDSRFFPALRPAFLATWIAQPDTRTRAIVSDGRLRAMAVRRRCVHGYKVGPLFADDETLAATLLADLTADIAGQDIYLDVPEVNAAALRLAAQSGLHPIFETARMYRGPSPTFNVAGVYGVTTFELG